MRSLTILLLAGLASASLAQPVADRPLALSPDEKAKARNRFPKFDPNAAKKASANDVSPIAAAPLSKTTVPAHPETSAKAASDDHPNAIPMSPYIVKVKPLEKRLPRPGAVRREHDRPMDPFLSPDAFKDEVVKKYLSSFDRNFLNRWTLPLFGASNYQRAKALYDADVRAAELNKIADILEVPGENTSEKEAKEMRFLYQQAVSQSRR
jgi:hypothetical protein